MLDEFDAIAASPEHHRLLFENELVRVLDVCIPPGQRTNVHTHVWGGPAQILSYSTFIRYDGEGNVMARNDDPNSGPAIGSIVWIDPIPMHSFENTGARDVHLIVTELKRS